MARGDSQVNFRIPEGLKEKLVSASGKSGRTITAEVTYLLEKGLENEEKINQINERLIALENAADRRKKY